MTGEASRRATARSLARDALLQGEPLAWFERLYAGSSDLSTIPWADLRPNPLLLEWLDANRAPGPRALTVGCGLGDDAEALSARGLAVTAFDIAPTAIARCRSRFPSSTVDYRVADLLDPPGEWIERFDFVLSSYTLQVLPPELRSAAAAGIASLVASGGVALVLARGRDESDPEGEMPWPLTPTELTSCFASPLGTVELADFVDAEHPPVRRLRLTLRRPVR
jgi:SAM-dependent methyltransferase